jgi:hypothetical protein
LEVQYEKFSPVLLPSEPLARVPAVQAKPLIEAVLVIAFPPVPAVLAVTVTVVPLALAVTVAEEQALMAAARFDASVVVELLAAKVPVVVPHAVDPFEPLDGAAQENPVDPVPESVTTPSVLAVTVTLLDA